jgi:hypothetical protein
VRVNNTNVYSSPATGIDCVKRIRSALNALDGTFTGNLPPTLDVPNVRDVFMTAAAIWLVDTGDLAIGHSNLLENR